MNSNENDSYEDSVDGLCKKQPAKSSSIKEKALPHYMRVTESSMRREQLRIEEDRRRSQLSTPSRRRSTPSSPVYDKNNLPRYMRDTASFRQRISVAPSPAPRVAPNRIREVDKNNLPRYMQETASYRSQVAKDPAKRRVDPKQIKEVDLQNKPSYMNETRSYRSKVQPDPPKPRVHPRQIKEVDTANKPRYMQSTQAWENRIKHAPVVVPRTPVPAKSIRPGDSANLPRYMQLTETAKMHTTTAVPAAKPGIPAGASRRVSVGREKESPRFMNATQSYVALCRQREEERKRQEEEEAERMRRRKSLAVRCTEWEQKRKNAEQVAIKRKERMQQEVLEERRKTRGGAQPRFMQDTACSRQLARKWRVCCKQNRGVGVLLELQLELTELLDEVLVGREGNAGGERGAVARFVEQA